MQDFQDRIVLVTGATSGIGAATAEAFAREGAKVVVSGRRRQKGAEVVDRIAKAGGEAVYIQADVSQEDEVRALVAQTLDRYGRLDIAFNNAGIEGSMGGRLDAQTQDEYRAQFDINVGGVLWAMKHELKAMRDQNAGVIVNTASIFSQIGMAGMSLYTATKHAVLGMTRAASIEYAKDNIRINAISPGGVETEMFERAAGPLEANSIGRQTFTNFHPMGRISQPSEQAEAVLFLASEKASFVNGANLAVDSGWSIS